VPILFKQYLKEYGIATFTTDLCDAISAEFGTAGVFVVAVNDSPSGYSYPARVRFEITQDDKASYRKAARFLNSSNVGLVCLQHEYGIYGGKAGSYVLELLRHLKKPVVTTLHTVLREPDADQRFVMQEIAWQSDRLIVMSEHSFRLLQHVFGVPGEKIDVIPHGIPDLPFAEPDLNNNVTSSHGRTGLLRSRVTIN
jgi:glycosyltransferase involved in cell wall biosynthesis